MSLGAISVMMDKILLTSFRSLLESLDIPLVTNNFFLSSSSTTTVVVTAFFFNLSASYFCPMFFLTSDRGEELSLVSSLSKRLRASSALFDQDFYFFVLRRRRRGSSLRAVRPDGRTPVSYTHLDVYKRQHSH